MWDANFGAPFYSDPADIPNHWKGADLAIGHPPCGSFSALGQSVASLDLSEEEREARKAKRSSRVGLIPLFIELVNKYRPKIFALDNLEKALKRLPKSWWREQLPKYKLTFLVINNWDYGSPQGKRVRLWVIGVRGKKRFQLKEPRTRLEGPRTGWEAIEDLPWWPWEDDPEFGHWHLPAGSKPNASYWGWDHTEYEHYEELGKVAKGFLSIPVHSHWPYRNRQGRHTHKPARTRISMEAPARTLSGRETLFHPLSGWPLTIRERARLMGWPDDFGLGEHELTRSNFVKDTLLTGKAVPSEFPRWLIPQLRKHLRRM